MELLTKYIKYRRKYYYFVILISLGLVTCDNNYKLTQEGKHFCYHNQKTLNKCEINSEVNISEPNENGTANVEFDFNPNCCYKLKLSYLEYNEQCKNQNLGSIYDHSFYSYEGIYESNIDNIPDSQVCTQKGIIQLKHLYTGCYKIEMEINHYRNEYILKKFTVKSEKRDFQYYKPAKTFTIQYEYLANSDKVIADLSIIHPYFELLPNVEVSIFSVVNSTKNDHLITEKIIPNRTNVNTKHLYNKNTSIKFNCTFKRKKFHCDIKGLDPGEYYYTYSLENIIQCADNTCTGCSVWKKCFIRGNNRDTEEKRPKAKPITSTDAPENSKAVLPLIIITVVLCILIILTAGIIYSRKKLCKRNVKFMMKTVVDTERGTIDTESLMTEDKQIFLLYPRDEKNVMQVIEHFRKALSEEGFKVFDIFDDEEEDEIIINPNDWMNKIFNSRTLKIILIRTYCWNYFEVPDDYKKADWRDQQFLNAKDRINSNQSNILTVDIGMRTNYTHPVNSAVVYDLPDNIEKLLKILHNNNSYSIREKNNNVWNEFQNKITNMQSNISSNKYLVNLLNVKNFESNF